METIAETVAIALPPGVTAGGSSRPRSTTGASRLSVISTPDEGRFLPGTLIGGRYRIIALLGRGGMGEVYRATDLTLAQSVALKFLPEDAATNQRLLERFHNEVRIARQVSHPNVCRVYDIGEAEGLPFISMEYVDGEDLASLLQRIGRLPAAKALEISRKVCAGVGAAHERGIIHRDLKPQNVMLNRRGEVVVMDFGLAAIADELQGPEARNGTPAYMSPEQLRGDSVTPKSDIYALGLMIYELFTGKHAFEANTVADLIRMQEAGRPASISTVAADADPAVENVVLRCLQPDPAQRPPSALAVAAALPGGDPLAAALAAGETPSPELVAASGQTDGIRLRSAAACLAFVIAAFAVYYIAMRQLSMLPLISMDLPPAVLERKARETAAALGYSSKPADWKSSFEYEGALIDHLKQQQGTKDWPRLVAAEPPVRFFYRESPEPLLSPPDGAITPGRPPLDMPGMISLKLDSRGLLRSFEAVAPRYEAEGAGMAPVDAASLFKMAGLDIAAFQETPPSYVPPLAFDGRRAWTGAIPGLPHTPVTVEIATWKGKLTSFFIRWPWTKPPGSAPAPSSWIATVVSAAASALVAALIFGAIFFARRNLKLGRGDKQGAFRVAGTVFILFLINVLAGRHMMPRSEVIGYFFNDLGAGLFLCTMLWLMYLALEPAVRSRWPHSMITWNRLLAGQIGDPRVGSHILIGSVLGMAMVGLFLWRQYWLFAGGGPPDSPNLDVLSGFRPLIDRSANTALNAVTAGASIFFLLCGVRALVRRDWIAALIAAFVLTLQAGSLRDSTNVALDVSLFMTIHTVFAFVLLRMGLIPAIVAIFTINMFGNIPAAAEWTAWYNPTAVLLIALLLSMPLYGFWRSQTRSAPAR
jgi:hypothetical protein